MCIRLAISIGDTCYHLPE